MRLFVAVDVPESLKERLEAEVVDVLRPALPEARWTRPEGRHLTLKFLGEVADERVPELSAALGEAVRGLEPFEAAFDRVGGFPAITRPRVLWVGIGEGAAAMAALAGAVESALEPLGFPAEGRPFTGHLTLARFRVPRKLEVPEVPVPDDRFAVEEVALFRSQLHPKGARYTALERFPLGG